MENTKLSKVYDYKCNICNKGYTSYQSMWNHNKKFHKSNDNTNNTLIIQNPDDNNTSIIPHNTLTESNNNLPKIKKYNCSSCNKEFNNFQNRWKHQKICKVKINLEQENKKLKEDSKIKELELDLQIKKEEKEILKLKLKLEKSEMIDNVTLRQLNKKLLERHNLIKKSMVNSNINSNNTNIQNSNNVVNNTFQLVGFGYLRLKTLNKPRFLVLLRIFGKEDIVELLTMKEKKLIMNARMGCLEKLIEIIHCGNYNQFKNIIVTNMKDGIYLNFIRNLDIIP